MDGLRWRTIGAAAGIVLALVWVMPNLVNFGESSWWPSKQKLNYGLDIQGGLHLVMGVDVDGVVKESTTRMMVSIKADLAKEQVEGVDVKSDKPEAGEVIITAANAEAKKKAEKVLADKY
ncbi:MAG TPA: hypothetical protein VN132_13730, partial [Bdellovibrio sp.]|nr:hypothetical protein [Bdellovibrio sp.]